MKRCIPLLIALFAACGPENPADLILLNGQVYTLDERRPTAEAVAIRGEHILAVGASDEIRMLASVDTRVIDLDGAFVSPGFNDSHVHVEGTGALLVGVNLLDVHEPVAFAERIAGAAERLPERSWITRGDWGAYEQWSAGSTGREGGEETGGEDQADGGGQADGPFTPHRDLIDAVTPNHPVLVNRFDRSMYLANSVALERGEDGRHDRTRRGRAPDGDSHGFRGRPGAGGDDAEVLRAAAHRSERGAARSP